MRKAATIFVLLFACLFCGLQADAAAAYPAAESELCFVLDDSMHDQLVCEREFNSNLGFPRLAAEVVPASVTPPSLRDGRCLLRLGVKCGVVCGREGGSVHVTSEYRTPSINSGSYAADYYVFRLRRLII